MKFEFPENSKFSPGQERVEMCPTRAHFEASSRAESEKNFALAKFASRARVCRNVPYTGTFRLQNEAELHFLDLKISRAKFSNLTSEFLKY